MRLINCTTLKLEEFFGTNIPSYAILSHTWGNDEVSFADYIRNQSAISTKEGYNKIAFTCRQALLDGLNYAWVDTCCIDKSSSAELSEAINSMFAWYRLSTVCYAYLTDVVKGEFEKRLAVSRWFTRGWTLQELLAPTKMIFHDRNWELLGSRLDLSWKLHNITSIDLSALESGPPSLSTFSVARKMSWASSRQTTREEDVAYSLLGIFDINMPLLYGEGTRAFVRLQEEIIKKLNDDSIFAWGIESSRRTNIRAIAPDNPALTAETMVDAMITPFNIPILAESPESFEACGNLKYNARSGSAFTLTNVGLQMELPCIAVASPSRNIGCIELLSCSIDGQPGFVGVLLSLATQFGGRSETRQGVALKYVRGRTVTVSPRLAAQATLQKFTIIHNTNLGSPKAHGLDCHRVLISPSVDFKNAGLQISHASGSPVGDSNEQATFTSKWDKAAMLLYIECNTNTEVLLEIQIHSWNRKSESACTVLARPNTDNCMVQRGTSFTIDGMRFFYHQLARRTDAADAIGRNCVDWEGRKLQLMVNMQGKNVHQWRIHELNLDVKH